MRGGALRYYQKGDGLTYNQIGRVLGGILRNSLKKIQPSVQRASNTAVKAIASVGRKKALGMLGNVLGVKTMKRKGKRKRKRKRVQKGSGLGGIRRRKRARRTAGDIFTY